MKKHSFLDSKHNVSVTGAVMGYAMRMCPSGFDADGCTVVFVVSSNTKHHISVTRAVMGYVVQTCPGGSDADGCTAVIAIS